MSRDQLLGRARRAVLAVAETAGGLGSRAKRRQADESPPTGRSATPGLPPRIERERTSGMPPARSEPTPGLPPPVEHTPAAGLPPRIERGGGAPVPPRIEREHGSAPELPPRIEHEHVPAPEPPPRVERPPQPAAAPPPVSAESQPAAAARERPEQETGTGEAPNPAVAVSESQPVYHPKHVRRPAAEPAPAPQPQAQTPPMAPPRPDPLASPVRNVLRSHQRLAYVLFAVILVVAAGYWVLRVHQRIGEQALEAGITKQQSAPTVRCASLQANGAAWACAVVYQAESACLIARVNLLGNWSTTVGQHRCERVPRLAALVPRTISATMVEADIRRRQGHPDFVCGKLPSHKVRWACERPLETGGQCLVVRVLQWTPWNVLDGGRACAHDPGLQKALRRAAADT